MKVIGIIVFFIFLFISMASAEISLKAEVDKASISTDETLTYKLIITSPEKKIPQPQIPKFEGFSVISQAQTSEISLGKGESKTFMVYVFILVPNGTGKFKIEPGSIALEGKTYATDTFEIEVTQGKTKPQVPLGPESPLPKRTQPQTEQPQITL